jgi:hypothetical protein
MGFKNRQKGMAEHFCFSFSQAINSSIITIVIMKNNYFTQAGIQNFESSPESVFALRRETMVSSFARRMVRMTLHLLVAVLMISGLHRPAGAASLNAVVKGVGITISRVMRFFLRNPTNRKIAVGVGNRRIPCRFEGRPGDRFTTIPGV